ncbi:hypothetical protein BGZ73_006146 [Actinomortierella ambigua]|nr:hypothetical protein BGZ73_006146 [Actinomortierella ambigua]
MEQGPREAIDGTIQECSSNGDLEQEQILVSNALDESQRAAGDEGVEASSEGAIDVGVDAELSDSLSAESRESATSLTEHVLQTVLGSLIHDEYILESASHFSIPEENRIVMFTDKHGARYMGVFLKECFFDDWLKKHSACTGALFTQRYKPYHFSTAVKENSTQSKKDRAGQIVYRYSCHRKCKLYPVKERVKGGKTGKTRTSRPTIRCNCKANISATFRPNETSDGLPGGCYKVKYAFEHNHRLGVLDNLGAMRVSAAIKERIKTMLLQDNFITYGDVYNVLYEITAKEAKKSEDEIESAKLWMEEQEKENYFTFYDETHGLYHGFSSPWQLDQLRRWGDVFFFDGTHHKWHPPLHYCCDEKETGFGIPVAFLLTKSQQWELVKEWLCQFKARLDQQCTKSYFPTAVITNQGLDEISAIRHAFNFKTPVFYCMWHILQAWERKLTSSNWMATENLSAPERKERISKAQQQLSGILYATEEQEANRLVDQFRAEWQPVASMFIEYLDKNHFMHETNKRHWMLCRRQEASSGFMNKNSYIGSWHKTLKLHSLHTI